MSGRRRAHTLPPYVPEPPCDCSACRRFALALEEHERAVAAGLDRTATAAALRAAGREVDRVHDLEDPDE